MVKLTLSWLATTLRPYSKNPRQAYQNILNQMLSILTDNASYWLDSSQTSHIMHNEYDFPYSVRDDFNKLSDEAKNERANKVFDTILAPYAIDKFISNAKQDVENSDLSLETKQILVKADKETLFPEITKVVVMTDNRIKLKNTLYSDGNKIIKLVSGDIISFAFNKKPVTCERIVVIPVDEDFTMTIDEKGDNPLISKDSIHGKWIIRMHKIGYTNEAILRESKEIQCKNGLKIRKLRQDKTEFYLVPISKLDDRNMAKSNKKVVKNALAAICQEYDTSGQGRKLFIPLLGTGRARVNITKQESIKLIQDAFLCKKNKMHGNINIVIYKKDIDEMGGILDVL